MTTWAPCRSGHGRDWCRVRPARLTHRSPG